MLAAVLLLVAAGCRSGRARGDVAVLSPAPDSTALPPPATPQPASTPEPPAEPASALTLADAAFDAGDWAGAIAGYRSHLEGDAAGTDADRALYRLALLHLGSGAPARDETTGYALLRRLVREHPESPYRVEAGIILGLTVKVDGLETEIERLESQLEALKRIDLERAP